MKHLKRYVVYLLGFLFLILLCFGKYDHNAMLSSADNLETIDISSDTLITQDFLVEHNNMESVGINTATCLKLKMEGMITLQLNLKNELIAEKDIEIKNFLDNNYYYIDIPLQKESKGKSYQLVVKGKNIPEETTLKLYANKMNEEEVLNIGYYYKDTDATLIIYPILYIWFLALVETLNMKKKKEVRKK